MKKILFVIGLLALVYIIYTIKQTGKKAGEVIASIFDGLNIFSSNNIVNRAVDGAGNRISGEEGYLTELWFRTFNSEAYRQEQEALDNLNK
jgi:hypothetical protein